MKVENTPIADLKIVDLKVHGDARGFFVERFNAKNFAAAGVETRFLQDNHSRSAPGILRGLHLQHSPAQGKLVGCIRGRIWDVAVDCRINSPTQGQHFGIELNEENFKLLWVPVGFAHGFCVLGDQPADVLYKVTEIYNVQGEIGINWNDPDLAIRWPISHPQLSDRDRNLLSYREALAKLKLAQNPVGNPEH